MILIDYQLRPVKPQHSTEHGNVLFIILIAVILFAALSYAITNSNRTNSSVSNETLDAQISTIMNYVSGVRGAITLLRARGCEENQISFYTPILLPTHNYTNPNSPSDESCNVFSPRGGGLSYVAPNIDWLDDPCDATDSCGRWVVTNGFRIPNIGITANNDIVLYLPDIDRQLCRRFNDKIGLVNPSGAAPTDNFGGGGGISTGNFTTSATFQIGDEHLPLAGLQEFCIQRTNGIPGNHFLFAVVMAR